MSVLKPVAESHRHAIRLRVGSADWKAHSRIAARPLVARCRPMRGVYAAMLVPFPLLMQPTCMNRCMTNDYDMCIVNRKLGLELVPRRGAEAVEPEDISLVELYRVHVESAERAAAWRGTLRRAGGSGSSFNSGTLTSGATSAPAQSHHLMERFSFDLSMTDLSRELWLVAWVVRVGRWAGAAGTERRGPVARRPLGAGVLPLADFLRQPGHHPAEREYTFKVYQCEEKDFHQLHDMLIRKQTNKCNILPGQPNYGIVVALRLLTNSASITEAVGSGATVTPKRGFPDIIMPGDVRNDLYLTLERAEFERGGKSTAKNVLATVNVHDNTGQLITRDKNERKLFGFSFARLMEASGATLRDGAHDLYVYKCDDPTKLQNASYLSLPSCANDTTRTATSNGVIPTFQRSSKEICTISTLLCSTKLTQNEDLLALLQWRARPERVQETLLRVLRLGDGLSCEELIKFLRDVLDALFALFSTEDGNSMRDFGHTAGGDEAELLLWLHDARRAQPLSERFRVRIARDGFSNYVDRLHANSTLFSECVWGASGAGASCYESLVLYHNNSPAWAEQLRLTVPLDTFTHAHVRIEFRHCSTRDKNERKLFGFSFARLMEASGATLRDGAHDLYVYKCDDPTKLQNASYLSLPSCANDTTRTATSNGVIPTFQRSSKEICTISTLLCTSNTPHSGTVFLVLVSICSLLDESRFQHFRPVLDVYIEEHFSAALVYKGLLSSVQHCAEWAAGAEGQEPIRKCLRSLGAVFRLAVRSRRLFARATGGQYEDSFRRDVRAALHALKALAQHPHREHLAPAQVALMTSWASVAKEVASALGPVEAARVTAAMLDAAAANAPPALAKARLLAAQDILKGPLGQDPEARNIVLTTACHHLRVHLARRDELSQCADMLGELVTLLWRKEDPDIVEDELDPDVDVLCLNTLDVLVETVLHLIGGNSPVLGSMVAGLLGTMELLRPAHYQRLWSHLAPHPHDRKPLKDFLMRAFLVFRHLIEQDVFPSDWMMLRVQSCKVLLSALQDLAKPLLERFMGDEPPQFDTQLWSGYLELGVALVTCRALQWERCAGRGPDRPRMRAAAGLQVLAVWSRLGPAQLHLIGVAVGALLEVTLVGALRRAALGALVALMAAERAATGGARRTEAALVDKLDSLVADNKADDHYRRLFDTVLVHNLKITHSHIINLPLSLWRVARICTTPPYILLRLQCLRMLYNNSVVHLRIFFSCPAQLHLIGVAVGALLEVTLVGALRRAALGALVALMAAERAATGGARRTEAALVDKLDSLVADNKADDHYRRLFDTVLMERVSTEGWREAGAAFVGCVTRLLERLLDYRAVMQGAEHRDKRMSATVNLLLYAETLNWDSDQIGVDPEHPEVPEWKRKEALYNQVLEYFDRGKCWEKGLPLLRELGALHEAQCDYARLAHVLRRHAAFLDAALQQLRPEPEYFRVGFYGKGCPLFLRNKQFVYRGQDYERIGAFTQRLQAEYVAAHILMRNTPPDDSIIAADGQYAVGTFKRRRGEAQEENISPYYVSPPPLNPLPLPIHTFQEMDGKGKKTKDLRHAHSSDETWKYFHFTPVFCVVVYACETMEATERELRSLISQYTADPTQNINPFSMRLQGTIDANVQGGISKYEQAFLTAEFARTASPRELAAAAKLRRLIASQLAVVDAGLTLHGRLAPEEYTLDDCEQQSGVMSSSLPAQDNRESVDSGAMAHSAPPLPSRPKSGDPRSPTRPPLDNYRDSMDEEVETRRHSRASWSEPGDAPPLPPRVSGDKRSWGEAPAVPRRAARSEADLDLTVESLRYEEIISMMSEPLRVEEEETPPPIPPKGLGHLSSFDSGHHENGESHC
ncbi:Dedicator of cytokinesis protein 4 [Papilio machaon]|uniref:Dedicator of cytokinesis protein 4 n=1 Tax=Papilio machaon TaxID=76193 RepID=A0A194QWF2_PAPMA|nr:Dedicator of cytokinesis protein 4 [Papilio machaon]